MSESSAEDFVCTFSQENFAICVNEIITKHGTSDAEATDWLSLIKVGFPGKKIHSYKTLKKKMTKNMRESVEKFETCGNGECCELNFF